MNIKRLKKSRFMRGLVFQYLCNEVITTSRCLSVKPSLYSIGMVRVGSQYISLSGSAKCRHKQRRELQTVIKYLFDLYHPVMDYDGAS